MRINRRSFLGSVGLAGAGISLRVPDGTASGAIADAQELQRVMDAPVLNSALLQPPVRVASLELLRNGKTFLVRARSRDGVESVTAPNSDRLRDTYPIFLNHVDRFFVGKDACELESLLWDLYRANSNYKLQGLAFWTCVAAAEMALLDLIGKTRGKPLGELFGPVLRQDIAVYRASGNRGNTPEAEIEYLQKLVAETGAKAIKFRLGGRMSRNADSLPGRTEKLIPMVRKAFGEEMTLYADSNSSYDVPNSIRIGRLMEEHHYAFLEEPVPFDHLWETKQVADALAMPVAGGEQEFSLRRFRWLIENRAVDVVQPDLHYFGGFIRATKVARMAAAAGLQCTPHMSGSGVGYINVLHFASFTPNAGLHQEYKGDAAIPCSSETSSLQCRNGLVRCPSGPGMGVVIEPDFVRKAEPVTTL